MKVLKRAERAFSKSAASPLGLVNFPLLHYASIPLDQPISSPRAGQPCCTSHIQLLSFNSQRKSNVP